jgi:hypothetical protein
MDPGGQFVCWNVGIQSNQLMQTDWLRLGKPLCGRLEAMNQLVLTSGADVTVPGFTAFAQCRMAGAREARTLSARSPAASGRPPPAGFVPTRLAPAFDRA